jgi:hypothetical protein
VSVWTPDRCPQSYGLQDISAEEGGIPWFELCCRVTDAAAIPEKLSPYCAGLTIEMLEDLLTPGLSHGVDR